MTNTNANFQAALELARQRRAEAVRNAIASVLAFELPGTRRAVLVLGSLMLAVAGMIVSN